MSSSRDFITHAESECLSQIESERSTVKQEIENIQHILWMNFHDSAKFTASLYKERMNNSSSLLYQFQTCAIAITGLYKDSLDAVDRAFELGQQYGTQQCKKDVASWTKRRKRKINRLQLLRHLSKKSGAPNTNSSDNDSDELSGVLSTLGVASPRPGVCRSPPQSTSGEASGVDTLSSPPRTPPHSSTASFNSRKRKASSLFDEFLEIVHGAKRTKP